MIIGISGKKQSGKDTVAAIIQYLIWKNKVEKGEKINLHYTFKDFTNSKFGGNTLSNWQIKKFADKLKDIVCLLIGCTREQLEDRKFKEKELGEEWIRYGYADGLNDHYRNGEWTKSMNVVFCDKERYEQELRINWQTAYKVHYTPRLLLQHIGTELFREQLHPNIWVNALMSEYKDQRWISKAEWDVAHGLPYNPENDIPLYPNWIISDVRFPNELQAIKDRGGITIRVNRPGLIESNHLSETSLDSATFDFVINNDKDIEHLINEVRKILEKLSII